MSTEVLDSWGMPVAVTDEHGAPVLLEVLDSYGCAYDEVTLAEWLEVEPDRVVRPKRRAVSCCDEVVRIVLDRTVRRYDVEPVAWRGWIRHYPNVPRCPGCEPDPAEWAAAPAVERWQVVAVNRRPVVRTSTRWSVRLDEIPPVETVPVGLALDAVLACVPWCWPAPITVTQLELVAA